MNGGIAEGMPGDAADEREARARFGAKCLSLPKKSLDPTEVDRYWGSGGRAHDRDRIALSIQGPKKVNRRPDFGDLGLASIVIRFRRSRADKVLLRATTFHDGAQSRSAFPDFHVAHNLLMGCHAPL